MNMKELVTNWKNRAIESWKKTYSRFVKIRGNPREIALGFALGLFVGMSPFMGAHTVIAVCLAALLQWNKISAAIAVWISNPFTAPIVYPITYFAGAFILPARGAAPPPSEMSGTKILLMLQKTPGILWTLVVGGIIVGIPLAIIGYHLSYSAVKKYQDDIKRKLTQRKLTKSSRANRRKKRKKKKKG